MYSLNCLTLESNNDDDDDADDADDADAALTAPLPPPPPPLPPNNSLRLSSSLSAPLFDALLLAEATAASPPRNSLRLLTSSITASLAATVLTVDGFCASVESTAPPTGVVAAVFFFPAESSSLLVVLWRDVFS